jgi:hypothetical protein
MSLTLKNIPSLTRSSAVMLAATAQTAFLEADARPAIRTQEAFHALDRANGELSLKQLFGSGNAYIERPFFASYEKPYDPIPLNWTIPPKLNPKLNGLDLTHVTCLAIIISGVILSDLESQNLEIRRVRVAPVGGIFIRLGHGDYYSHIEVFNDGDIVAATQLANNEPDVWEVRIEHISGTISKINGFISSGPQKLGNGDPEARSQF